MKRLPGTGLPVEKVTSATAIMICGENPSDVLEAVDAKLRVGLARLYLSGFESLISISTVEAKINSFS